jgi:predicted amidophosphoribosyltransferase
MHPKKRFARGYNPSLRLASHIARHTAQRVARRRCHKIKATAAQFSLKASERKSNLKNAFACQPLKGPVILLDDVISTGSTVKAVSESLLQAGAASVTVWAIANNIKDGINERALYTPR